MYVVTVTFRLSPGAAPRFLPLMLDNARQSLRDEPGCQRFDVCTRKDDADEVYLYELYDDRAAFDAHLASAHFRRFDSAVAGMIADKTIRTYDEVLA